MHLHQGDRAIKEYVRLYWAGTFDFYERGLHHDFLGGRGCCMRGPGGPCNALPVMAGAILCIWAAHTSPAPPRAADICYSSSWGGCVRYSSLLRWLRPLLILSRRRWQLLILFRWQWLLLDPLLPGQEGRLWTLSAITWPRGFLNSVSTDTIMEATYELHADSVPVKEAFPEPSVLPVTPWRRC